MLTPYTTGETVEWQGRILNKPRRLPEIPLDSTDTYLILSSTDRLDLIAEEYYGKRTLRWVLYAANPHLKTDSLYQEAGTQLRVPGKVSTYLNTINR